MAEGRVKRARLEVSWCNLHLHVPWVDVRRMIYAYLNRLDRMMVEIAHDSSKEMWLLFRSPWEVARWANANIMDWILQRPGRCSLDADYVAHFGNLVVIQKLASVGRLCTEAGLRCAIQNGHVKVVEWLVDGGGWHITESKWNLCDEAAQQGHLDVLKLLRSRGYKFSDYTSHYALMSGHTDMFRYVVERGCFVPPCNDTIWYHIGYYGHLWWLRANIHHEHIGYYRRTVLAGARKGRQEAVIDWLHENFVIRE